MNINKNDDIDEKDDEEGGGGNVSGGAGTSTGGTGGYRYLDPSSQNQREDFLSPEDYARLLAVHQGVHKERVNKQKITRKEREMVKQGSANLVSAAYDRSRGYGHGIMANSQFLPHPLAYKFSGIRDIEVSIFPSEHTPDTNKNEYQNRLDKQNRNELRLQNDMRNRPTLKRY